MEPRGSGRFATTSWSVVLAAGDRGSVNSREALSTLCQVYWYPLYAFARRKGMNAESAQDSAQGFFTNLLEKGSLRHAQPEKGRFRSFLLASFKNFVADQRAYERRKKRGGDVTKLPIDFDTAEGRYRKEPADQETPERIYERRWAMALLVSFEIRCEISNRASATWKLRFEQRQWSVSSRSIPITPTSTDRKWASSPSSWRMIRHVPRRWRISAHSSRRLRSIRARRAVSAGSF